MGRRGDEKKLDDSSSESEENEEASLSYEEKMRRRRGLRKSLNQLDLNYEYLKRKKDLSEIEKRVLNRLMYSEKSIQTDPEVSEYSHNKTITDEINIYIRLI